MTIDTQVLRVVAVALEQQANGAAFLRKVADLLDHGPDAMAKLVDQKEGRR